MGKATVVIIILVGLASFTRAEPPDVQQILRAVDETTRAVKSVRYQARRWGVGRGSDSIRVIEGSVAIQALPDGSPPRLRIDMKSDDKQRPLKLSIIQDRESNVQIDWVRQQVVRSPCWDVERLRAQNLPVFMIEYVHPTPFADERNASLVRYEGRQTIQGVECDVVYVVYNQRPPGQSARWYFGVNDHLPHRVDRIQGNDDHDAIVLELRTVSPSPLFDAKLFAVEFPANFDVREVRRINGRTDRREPPLIEVGREAPGFELPSARGPSVVLRRLRGRVVVLDFWNAWGAPCKTWIPRLQQIVDEFHEQKLTVFGINVYEDDGVDPAAALRALGGHYPTLIDADGAVARAYRVAGVPSVCVIDSRGRIVYCGTGPDQADAVREAIRSALERAP